MSMPATSHFDVLQERVPRRVADSPQAAPVRFNDVAAGEPVDVNSTRLPQAPTASSVIEEERDGSECGNPSRMSEEWSRFCGHCGNPIPWERLANTITRRAKVFFCSDLHRFADANAKNKAAKRLRQAKGLCSQCHGRGYTRVNRPQRSSER